MTNWRGYDLLSILTRCGQRDDLRLCLDAGDANSYSSGQSWLDRSGNGYDFFRGADGSASATDPTFNGTAGQRTSGEYFSFDGGDFFTYDTTNETWMQNLHKDDAIFTFLVWMQIATLGAIQNIFGTRGASAGNTGMVFQVLGGGELAVDVRNAGTSAKAESGPTVTAATWQMVALSLNEPVGAGGLTWFLNGATATDTSTYSSPASGNASFTAQIGAGGNAVNPVGAGSRMGMFAAWEGRALSAGELNAIWMYTRGRFGV